MSSNRYSKKHIMDHFPRDKTPREVQTLTLKALEQHWDSADVFVVSLSVGAGKSAVGKTVANWRGSSGCAIITPTKVLVDQYAADYPDIHVLRAKGDYVCSKMNMPLTKLPKIKGSTVYCLKEINCKGCNGYRADLRKARSKYTYQLLGNYYIYMAHKLFKETVVIDEAHKAIDILKKLHTKNFWAHKIQMPTWVKLRVDLEKWIGQLTDREKMESNVVDLIREVESDAPKFLVNITQDDFEGRLRRVVRLEPLDVSGLQPFLWPKSVKKLVLMSGTISIKDVEQLGLAGKKVKVLDSISPIPIASRPVIVPPEAVNMSFRQQPSNLIPMMELIKDVAEGNPTTKGLIHATYSLAIQMKTHFKDDPRFLFHNQSNKQKMYQHFRDTDEPKILVASGMNEGIDLAGPEYGWQIIAKVPWPSLGDPAIKHLAEMDSEWYDWETWKQLLQACGRICRGPDDYGETIILDSSFKKLWNGNLERRDRLVPKWFRDSVTFW